MAEGRRLLLTACLPVYMGSGKTVNFSHRSDKWENQRKPRSSSLEGLLEARQKPGSGEKGPSQVPGPNEEGICA